MCLALDEREIRDDRNHMSMLEDFWLPRREGGRGTEITTLPGGSNLGEIDDINYFQRKLYLVVPCFAFHACDLKHLYEHYC